ncbi:MAG: hydroxymethylglutaryl-CoA lyase [Candidatus Dormiibacterota bacterium]
MPPPVSIVEVFPRDGLQVLLHEPDRRVPSTDEKVQIVREIDGTGVAEIEITGFVHPRVIPALADAEAVAAAVLGAPHRATLRALVPNYRGAERAIDAGLRKLSCLIVASETYQRLNSRMSVADNLVEIERIVNLAATRNVEVTVGVGTSFVCPYEGLIEQPAIERLCDRFQRLGITEVTLADSIGLAWPTLVRDRCAALLERWPDVRLGLHLHTLAGLGLANAFAGREAGVSSFDGAAGGIGGGIAMPVHTNGMANVATEDLVYLFESCGIDTGVDLDAIAAAGRHAQGLVGGGGGHVTSFGSLSSFLARSRTALPGLAAAPPGASDRAVGQ